MDGRDALLGLLFATALGLYALLGHLETSHDAAVGDLQRRLTELGAPAHPENSDGWEDGADDDGWARRSLQGDGAGSLSAAENMSLSSF